MTKLIHPYSLQAFPTEKILKEFKPVRGCHVHGKIELPPGQAELLWASLRNRDSDPLGPAERGTGRDRPHRTCLERLCR